MPRILIVGAGIAGDTLAVSLDRAGWHVVVVDIAPALRSGGQTVDLRGTSTEVLERLGLLDQCRALLIEQRGIAWVDTSGAVLAAMPVEAFGGAGFVSSDELLRTDLARVIHAAGGDGIEYRWNDTVESIDDNGTSVHVTFRDNSPEEFDLVVGADGAHSRTRSIVFGPEDTYRKPLGLAHAWFTLTETSSTPPLDGWFLVHNAPGSRAVEARPGHPGTQEIGFTFAATSMPPRRDREAQQELVRQNFSSVGWRTDELLDAMPTATDFAIDTFDQIQMDTWHRGRVILLGDSAWCASPLSGLGTALALRGAESLAGELVGEASHAAPVWSNAFRRFETGMRPTATAAAKLLPGRVRSYAPRTSWGIRVVARIMRVVQNPLLDRLTTRIGSGRGH